MPLNIPFVSKKKEEKPTEPIVNSFLCLVFTEGGVRAAFWYVDDGQITVKAKSSLKTFTNDDEAIIAADDVLKELGKDSEGTDEVVFGFDPKWVNDSGLIKDKKPFIKKLTENLSLKPVGFVVLTDAMVQDVFTREKNISQILVYIQETALSLIHLNKGKVSQQISVGRSDNTVSDIVEGLARFAKDDKKEGYLPAKMVLSSLVLTKQDLQDIRSKIIDYDWAGKHPFVQTPLIEKVAADKVLEIVVEQGGLAVAETRGLSLEGDKQEPAKEEVAGAEDFGFSSVEPDSTGDNFAPLKTNEEKAEATSFGVPITQEELPKERERRMTEKEKKQEAKEEKILRNQAGFVAKIQRWYKNHPHKNMILGGSAIGLVSSIILLVGWLNFAYKVEVSLALAEKVIAKDVELVVDTTVSSSSVEELILKGELESAEFSGTKVVDTTGVKLVGEKAKGKITILNKTTSPKTFSAGTTFANGTLKFTLNEETTVASASVTESGTSETKDYGKVDADVTAFKIGAEGNIVKETELSVASFAKSTYSAFAVDTFTGGSSREIRVIALEDQLLALSELKKELFKDAQEDFDGKSGDGTYYILSGKQTVTSEDYGGDVGEEADQIALELTMEFEAVKYYSEDIKPLVLELLKEDLPENYEFTDQDPEILTSPKDDATSSAQVVLDANISTKALPIFDENNLIPVLKGLPLEAISGKATERPEIESASYAVKPALARSLVTKVPKADNRIIIVIEESE